MAGDSGIFISFEMLALQLGDSPTGPLCPLFSQWCTEVRLKPLGACAGPRAPLPLRQLLHPEVLPSAALRKDASGEAAFALERAAGSKALLLQRLLVQAS